MTEDITGVFTLEGTSEEVRIKWNTDFDVYRGTSFGTEFYNSKTGATIRVNESFNDVDDLFDPLENYSEEIRESILKYRRLHEN